MAAEKTPQLLFLLAEQLREDADHLTDRWLEELSERLGVRPGRLLPTRHLRDSIPEVLRAAAEFLELPTADLPNRAIDILRNLAQLRLEQGYDIQEVLSEIDVLAELVHEWAARRIEEEDGGHGGEEVLRAGGRLSALLRRFAAVAVGTYREEELRHARELADGLGDFADTLRHELANPLEAARLSAELLGHDEVIEEPARREKHVGVIRDRLERIRELIDDVRMMATAEDARSEPRWVLIRDVIEGVLEEVGRAAERHGVELRVDEPLEELEVDAVRVEIALMNLVSNAVKFSDPEKEERWVRLSVGPAESEGLEGGRRITVEDNGRGIDEDLQNKVFQRFFRAHPEVEGTGMGLEIAKRVVEQRGGRLWFESERGVGSRFYIEIPQRLASGESRRGELDRPGSAGAGDGEGGADQAPG